MMLQIPRRKPVKAVISWDLYIMSNIEFFLEAQI